MASHLTRLTGLWPPFRSGGGGSAGVLFPSRITATATAKPGTIDPASSLASCPGLVLATVTAPPLSVDPANSQPGFLAGAIAGANTTARIAPRNNSRAFVPPLDPASTLTTDL